MKHNFDIGIDLLCFEPDETKEKLIYHARVINHSGFDTKGKIKIPLYLVHFLGWSKKWDRIVPESLLLPLTDFNRKLQEKIEFIAKNEKRHQLRHDLVDEVLELASKVTNESRFDWNEIENRLQLISNKFKPEKKTEIVVRELSVKEESENGKDNSASKSTVESCDNVVITVENTQLQKENDVIHVTFSPKISLTESQLNLLLVDKLENSKLIYPPLTSVENLHKQAWNPSVVDILQNYVDAFPVAECRIPNWKEFDRFYDMDQDGFIERIENFPSAILDLSFDFNEKISNRKQFKLPQWPDSELNSDYLRSDVSSQLCFEVCSGLRVLFDFYCRHLLLYENEISHYEMIDELIVSESQYEQIGKSIANETPLKLLPEEYRNHRNGFQPCLFFGYPHLLRLLYKLPTILSGLGLTRCSLAIVLRHCYSLIKFLDISFIGASTVRYRQIEITNNVSCKTHVQNKTKRKSSPQIENIVKNEPRILLRRLVLEPSTDQIDQITQTEPYQPEIVEPRITRSAFRLKNK